MTDPPSFSCPSPVLSAPGLAAAIPFHSPLFAAMLVDVGGALPRAPLGTGDPLLLLAPLGGLPARRRFRRRLGGVLGSGCDRRRRYLSASVFLRLVYATARTGETFGRGRGHDCRCLSTLVFGLVLPPHTTRDAASLGE